MASALAATASTAVGFGGLIAGVLGTLGWSGLRIATSRRIQRANRFGPQRY